MSYIATNLKISLYVSKDSGYTEVKQVTDNTNGTLWLCGALTCNGSDVFMWSSTTEFSKSGNYFESNYSNEIIMEGYTYEKSGTTTVSDAKDTTIIGFEYKRGDEIDILADTVSGETVFPLNGELKLYNRVKKNPPSTESIEVGKIVTNNVTSEVFSIETIWYHGPSRNVSGNFIALGEYKSNDKDEAEENAANHVNGDGAISIYIIDPTNPLFDIPAYSLTLPSIYKPFYITGLIDIFENRNLTAISMNIFNTIGVKSGKYRNIGDLVISGDELGSVALSNMNTFYSPLLLSMNIASIRYSDFLFSGACSPSDNISIDFVEKTPDLIDVSMFNINEMHEYISYSFYQIAGAGREDGSSIKRLIFSKDNFVQSSSIGVRYYLVNKKFQTLYFPIYNTKIKYFQAPALNSNEKYEVNRETGSGRTNFSEFMSVYGCVNLTGKVNPTYATNFVDYSIHNVYTDDKKPTIFEIKPDEMEDGLTYRYCWYNNTQTVGKGFEEQWQLIGLLDPLTSLDDEDYETELSNGTVLTPQTNFISTMYCYNL